MRLLSAPPTQVTAVTAHPTHQYFVTASMDKTWAFYDADTATCLVQVGAVWETLKGLSEGAV